MIKRLLTAFLFSSAVSTFLHAQILSVAPGTDLNILAGTTLSADSLVITPSSDFTMNGLTISKSASPVHTLSDAHISKTYDFSGTSNPFSGVIRFYYDDAELNGLDEPTLEVKIYNGSLWVPVSSAANDVTNDYVLTSQVSGISLNELTLVNPSGSLPLLWGIVNAYRKNKQVEIEWNTMQENNVSHFNVERSTDTRTWSAMNSDIPANNLLVTEHYVATDNNYYPGTLYYRIKQTDREGRVSYSAIVSVAPEADAGVIVLFPNPVTNVFKLRLSSTAAVSALFLYNSSGVAVKTWNVLQDEYNIGNLPSGIYHLKVVLNNNEENILKINKQ